MSTISRPDLLTRLNNAEYRAAFVSSLINSTIAYQIRGLRKKNDLDQAELGALTGMKQTAISRLENPDYGNLSVNTLKRIAKALDVGLIVRFAPYSDIVRWRLSMSQADMAPPSFARDRMMHAGIQAFFHGDTHTTVRPIRSNTGPGQLTSDSTIGQRTLELDADTTRGAYWEGSTASGKAA
jgi:transcriptional regulator with XRE-family HTH domain